MTDIFMPEPNMQLVRDVRERREERTQTSDGPLLDEVANALESAQTELRQERERAELFKREQVRLAHRCDAAQATLSRAEETIAAALAEEERCTDQGTRMWRILTEYDKQKGADSGSPSGGPEPLEGTE